MIYWYWNGNFIFIKYTNWSEKEMLPQSGSSIHPAWVHHQHTCPMSMEPTELPQGRLSPMPGGWEERCPLWCGTMKGQDSWHQHLLSDHLPGIHLPFRLSEPEGLALSPSLLRLRRAGWTLSQVPPVQAVTFTSYPPSTITKIYSVSPNILKTDKVLYASLQPSGVFPCLTKTTTVPHSIRVIKQNKTKMKHFISPKQWIQY